VLTTVYLVWFIFCCRTFQNELLKAYCCTLSYFVYYFGPVLDWQCKVWTLKLNHLRTYKKKGNRCTDWKWRMNQF